MVNMKQLSSEGKIAYLIKPILKVLQEAGGQLERSEIKARIADLDDQIAEFAEIEKKSKKTGNTYKEFNFKFNFAIKDLFFVGLLLEGNEKLNFASPWSSDFIPTFSPVLSFASFSEKLLECSTSKRTLDIDFIL